MPSRTSDRATSLRERPIKQAHFAETEALSLRLNPWFDFVLGILLRVKQAGQETSAQNTSAIKIFGRRMSVNSLMAGR